MPRPFINNLGQILRASRSNPVLPRPFEPTDFLNLQMWYKADSLSQSDNTAITDWLDSSGNGRHLTQGTAGNRPTFQTNERNGLPAVEFDGSNDHFTRASVTNFLGANAGYVFCVMNMDAEDANNCALCDWKASTDANRFEIVPGFSTNQVVIDWGNVAGGGRISGTGAGSLSGAWRIFEFNRNVNAGKARQNNVDYLSSTYSDAIDQTQSATFFMGANNDLSIVMDGKIGEFILYSRFLTTDEQNVVRGYLSNKWAIVL